MIQIAQFARADGDRVELIQQTERLQSAAGMRQDIDAHTELLDVCGCFKDGARNAQLMQRQRQSQPADSGSCNKNALVIHRDFLRFEDLLRCYGFAAADVSRKLITIRLYVLINRIAMVRSASCW